MKTPTKIMKIALVAMILTTISPLTEHRVKASEENILGIPVKEFDNMSNTGKKYSTTLKDYQKHSEIPGYQLKLKQDAYTYMYEILLISEKLGNNQLEVVSEHIQTYNKELKPPLTEEDQINSSMDDEGNLTINSTSADARSKLLSLSGSKGSATEDGELTYIGLLKQLRGDLGYTLDLVEGDNPESTDVSGEKANAYLREHISEIRYLFTSTKDYLIDSNRAMAQTEHVFLSKYFVDTYNKVIKRSVEAGVDELKDLDLLGERDDAVFNAESTDAHESIGTWIDGPEKTKSDNRIETAKGLGMIEDWMRPSEEYTLDSLSEYMLKNIAASSTFEPFRTNLNSNRPFSFLGEQSKIFHNTFGTKRKMLLTPTEAYNNLDSGIDINAEKAIKYMTLGEFLKNPDKPKILYLDNLAYSLPDIEKEQDQARGENIEGLADESTTTGADTYEDNNNQGFWKKWVGTPSKKAQLWVKDRTWFSGLLTGGEAVGKETTLSRLVFASGDLDKHGKLKGDTHNKRNDINEAYLIYNNIIKEYYEGQKGLSVKPDLKKPLYIDIYGNIVSASGVVIIPAMSNPFLFEDTVPTMNFNRAYIESYPQFSIKNGSLIPGKKEEGKIALGMKPMGEDDIKVQEDLVGKKFGFPKNDSSEENEIADEGEIGEETAGEIGGQDYGLIPGIHFGVTKVGKPHKPNWYTIVNNVQPIAYKFDSEYKPMKALDIWSFATTKGSSINDYTDVRAKIKQMLPANSIAMIEDYTVSLSYGEEGTSELATFLKLPDSEEVLRFMYYTNLEYIAEIENNEIHDKKTLDRKVALRIAQEVYINGVYDLNQINSLMPNVVTKIYDDYVEFLMEMANNRYDSVLGNDTNNNILYAKSIEEVGVLQAILPLVYKFILLVAIFSIILYIILTVISKEGKLKQAIKVMTVLYLVIFLMNISGWMLDTLVNKPTASMFSKETSFWTVMEQEKNTHLKKLKTRDEIVEAEPLMGSKIKLYQIPYTYPYRVLEGNTEGNITLDEFYLHFLRDDNRFRDQNNEMYVEGDYLMTDTSTVFQSSSIHIEDQDDIRKKLIHDIYLEPEIAYYMPYYMFIDNIIFNLNSLTEINFRVPYDIAYASGTIKSTGRMSDYLNSMMFLDYETYLGKINDYESSDKISEELSIAKIQEVTEKYGNPDDFLGIRKILQTVPDDEIKPFTAEGIKAATNSGWYPDIPEMVSKAEKVDLNRRALKVNDKVKRFMIELADLSGGVADEHIIKTIALYASFEFNKEFKGYTEGKLPTKIELSAVPIETLLMGLSIPRKDMIDNTLKTYPNYVIEEVGYIGLMISSVNDLLIVVINYIKPFMIVIIWVMAGLIIFVKKVVIPDPNNKSILGSLKMIMFYILSSLVYSFALVGIMWIINAGEYLIVAQLLLFIVNIVYISCLLFMVYTLISDSVNMGSSLLFKGLENTVRTAGHSLTGAVASLPLMEKFFGRQTEGLTDGVRHLGDYLEQKGIKSTSKIDNVGIRDPIDFGAKTMRKINGVMRGNKGNNNNRYYGDSDKDNYRGKNDSDTIVELPKSKRTMGTPSQTSRFNENALRQQQQETLREEQLKDRYVRDYEEQFNREQNKRDRDNEDR